jgi:hypothetical protein
VLGRWTLFLNFKGPTSWILQKFFDAACAKLIVLVGKNCYLQRHGISANRNGAIYFFPMPDKILPIGAEVL